MSRELIKFVVKEQYICNVTVHTPDKVLVATTLVAIKNFCDTSNWEELFRKIYSGESSEEAVSSISIVNNNHDMF